MSTSLSPQSSSSPGGTNHPTRQQLDELDALLQRMLALPVNQADDVIAEINAAPETASTLPQDEVPQRTAELDEIPAISGDNEATDAELKEPRLDEAHVARPSDAPEDADSWVPLSSTWKPSPHTWKPLAQSWQQPRAKSPPKPAQESPPSREELVEAPAIPPGSSNAVIAAKPPSLTPVDLPAPAPVPAQPVAVEPPPPEWIRPLVWFNAAFDVLLLPWGLPGRWLRRDGPGRPVLGIVGLVLLATAAGLTILEWFGWTWDALFDKIR
jgi:hypothetical protein